MLTLGDSELDLYQLLRQVNYQPSDLHSGRLKHISLPQCTNKEARASFETALCGVFSTLIWFTNEILCTHRDMEKTKNNNN